MARSAACLVLNEQRRVVAAMRSPRNKSGVEIEVAAVEAGRVVWKDLGTLEPGIDDYLDTTLPPRHLAPPERDG